MDEENKGVTPAGGDALQEDDAASETPAEETPQDTSQDAPDQPDEGEEGDEQEAAADKTDRGTKPAKEPESRYYQQLKNENADMRALLNNPKALKEYLHEAEGTEAPAGAEEDDLKQIVEQATMDNGQVDAYKLADLMDKRMMTKVTQGMQHLAKDMTRAQTIQRSYDSDKATVRADHPELDPRKKEFDPELEEFVGERYIAQGGLEGKVTLQQVVDQTFTYLEKVRGSATKQAETEVVRKQVGAIPQSKVSGNTADAESNMTPEQILASRVQKQLQRRS